MSKNKRFELEIYQTNYTSSGEDYLITLRLSEVYPDGAVVFRETFEEGRHYNTGRELNGIIRFNAFSQGLKVSGIEYSLDIKYRSDEISKHLDWVPEDGYFLKKVTKQ